VATEGTEPQKRRRRGTGAVYQRPDGLWAAMLELPPDPRTGKRRRKQVTGKTQKLVEGKLDRLRLELQRSGDLPTASMPLARWLDYWLENINQSKPTTRLTYRTYIEQYIKPLLGKVKLDQLTPTDVRRLERHIVGDLGKSPTTALQGYQILAKALKDAEQEGRVQRNVARLVNPPRRAIYRAQVLDAEQAIQVLRTVANDRLGSRWAAALLTGARQGEMLGLELDRVQDGLMVLSWQLQRIRLVNGKLDAPADWEHRHLTGGLYLARPKSRAGWREVPLEEPLRSIIERRARVAMDEPNPFGLLWTADQKKSRATHELQPLDGMPIDPSADNRAWHDVLDRAGVPQVRLHDARHSAVTLLYELGVSEPVIQDIVGQSTLAVTRGYRHGTLAPRREAMAALGSLLGMGDAGELEQLLEE
jgi:integrase